MKHTKGPWRRQGAIIWGKEIQRQVALVTTTPGEPEQDNANARLIKAAPELLEALKGAVETEFGIPRDEFGFVDLGNPEYKPAAIRLKRALAAIAKAEGREE